MQAEPKTIEPGTLISPWDRTTGTVTLMISPCRSGSTVMLRIFGYGGFAAYFQPIKNALRWRLEGQDRPWLPPQTTRPVFVKETFGPFNDAEVDFDPLQELLKSGVSPDEIRLVLLLRDPGMVWASWHSLWGKAAQIRRMTRAYAACLTCATRARGEGIPVDVLDYGACVTDPAPAIGRIFQAAGQAMQGDILDGWQDRPAFGAPGSGVHLPLEPDAYITPGAHDPVIASRRFGAVPPRAQPSQADLRSISDSGLAATYGALHRFSRAGMP